METIGEFQAMEAIGEFWAEELCDINLKKINISDFCFKRPLSSVNDHESSFGFVTGDHLRSDYIWN